MIKTWSNFFKNLNLSIFDEVKLTETIRYSDSCVVGYAQNGSYDSEVLATHALVIVVVCHFGGPVTASTRVSNPGLFSGCNLLNFCF